jgi:hypothetical protein
MATYATVYEKESGKAIRCYPATIQEFMATGKYTLEAPAGAKAPEAEVKAKQPTAAREAERLAASANFAQTLSAPVEEVAPSEEAVEESPEDRAPMKKAPRRRVSE